MTKLQIDDNNSLFYQYTPVENKPTVVFINALTGNTGHWEEKVAPMCREQGLGTLSYNMRGQIDTQLDDSVVPDCDLIVSDLLVLLKELQPNKPILCGLSIGGLFAAKAVLAGQPASGLILLNTLREIGPRLSWLNQGMVHVLDTGGFPLMLDMFLPLLTSENFHANARANHLQGNGYQPEDTSSGAYRLMQAAVKTDWDINYEALKLPVLSISGLQDRVFFDAAVVKKLGARIPDWQHMEWQDAGHLLPLEVPENLAEAVISFSQQHA